MVSKGIPSEFAYEAMILMEIVSAVSENKIWFKDVLDLLETFFHFGSGVREKAILKRFNRDDLLFGLL